MSALEQMLAAVGVGAAQVELSLDSGVRPRGGCSTGRVRLAGGLVEQKIESLTVRLEEFITRGKSSEWKPRDERVLTTGHIARPGELTDFPFRLPIPEDARLSNRRAKDIWRVSVTADVLWARNPWAGVPVQVVPHCEVTAVQRALEKWGFTKTGVYVDFAMPESVDSVIAYYRAPPGLREQIDGASLHLRIYGEHVFGRFILNRHQHSVGEHLLALVGADREEHGFQIPRSALLNAQGGPESAGADIVLDDILSRALVLPANADAKTLLRPASCPPADSGALLRPAESHGSEAGGELLRPADEPPPAS